MLHVDYAITYEVLEDDLENTTSFFVNQSKDTIGTIWASETAELRLAPLRRARRRILGVDVVTKDLSVAISASHSEPLSSFASARHVFCVFVVVYN